jgi:hypothetical protein
MSKIVKSLDAKLGYPIQFLREYSLMKQRLKYFNEKLKERKQLYGAFEITKEYESVTSELDKNGFVILKNFVDTSLLNSINDSFEFFLDNGENLLNVSNDSMRIKGDTSGSKVFLDKNTLQNGQKYCRNLTNNMAMENPMINIPLICDLVFSERFTNISGSYLGVIPALGGLNLRKSFVNGLPEFDTQYFHVDPNSIKFLKFFLYLNNVDEKGGPFTYVKGSHKNKFTGWQRKYRWSHEEIAGIYGDGSILKLTGNIGDLIIADTNGFHRGAPLVRNDRSMLTFDYVIHPEFDGKANNFKIYSSNFKKLNENKALADFLDII